MVDARLAADRNPDPGQERVREMSFGRGEARHRRAVWRAVGAGLLVALYLLVGVFDHELWPPIEQAVAGVTWEMYTHDEIAIPRINGIPYLEKPPLAYGLSWLCCRIAGHLSAGLVRLPAALSGLLSLAVLFWISRRLYGEAVAWISTGMCASTFTFYDMMHRASSDSVALLFIFLCFALFLHTLEGDLSRAARASTGGQGQEKHPAENAPSDELGGGADRTGPPSKGRTGTGVRWSQDLPFCLVLAASFYAKNFYTFLIVVPPVTVFLLMTRQFRRLLGIGITTAIALALLVGPWCYALHAKGGMEYLRIVFFDNTLGRFFTFRDTTSFHIGDLNDAFRTEKPRPPFGVARWVGADMLPWPLIFVSALWTLFRGRERNERRLFLKIAFVAIIVSLSLSSSSQMTYFLPIVFVLSLVSAEFFHDLLAQGRIASRGWQLAAANLAAVVVAFALAPLCAGLLLHSRLLTLLVAPNLVAVVALLIAFKGRWLDDQALRFCGVFIACSALLTLAFAVPLIDALRSWRPFFDQTRSEIDGRRTFTSLVNDRRLPAMNFYWDRRLELVEDPEQIPPLLASPEKVAIVVAVGDYSEQKDRLAKIPHRAIRASRGADLFVLLENP
jgi:4-amino-4-deoxy-L-arabinose transferase-like glycosyltransferase